MVWLVIVILVILVMLGSRPECIESMQSLPNIVLLGDSILNNSNYVSKGHSVPELLSDKCHLTNLAQDGATINDCYHQIQTIPQVPPSATFILSAGGNDLIASHSTVAFNSWIRCIQAIKQKFPLANIAVLTLYQPTNSKYRTKRYTDLIHKWNHLILTNSSQYHYKVLRADLALTEPSDFVYDIEPSVTGGKKIADLIKAV